MASASLPGKLPPARWNNDKEHSSVSHDIDTGSAVFCGTCSRLFRHYSNEDIDQKTGELRCEECAAKARLRAEVLSNATEEQFSPQVRRGTLRHLVREAAATAHDSVDSLITQPTGTNSTAAQDGAAAGAAAQQDVIQNFRRENRELRRRLFAQVAVHGGETVDAETERTATAAEFRRRSASERAISALDSVLDALVPAPLRATSRYLALDEAVSSVRMLWREDTRRLSALQSALTGSEATCATLQEELLLLETSEVRPLRQTAPPLPDHSLAHLDVPRGLGPVFAGTLPFVTLCVPGPQVTLGQLVKSQSAEIAELRREATSAEQRLARTQLEASSAQVRHGRGRGQRASQLQLGAPSLCRASVIAISCPSPPP